MQTINFRPVGDRIIVFPEDKSSQEVKLSSGIILSGAAIDDKELPQVGTVAAVGTGGTFPDCPDPSKVFKVGDVVYFNKYAGEEFEREVEQEIEEPQATQEWKKEIRDGSEVEYAVEIPKDKQVMVKVKKMVKQKFLVLRLDAIFGILNA